MHLTIHKIVDDENKNDSEIRTKFTQINVKNFHATFKDSIKKVGGSLSPSLVRLSINKGYECRQFC